jgi:hypothetical protein
MAHYASLTRPQIRETFAAFCAARPAGAKFAHRKLRQAGGLQPVDEVGESAGGLHAACGRAACCWTPACTSRACIEAIRSAWRSRPIPGLLARELIGRRSYKSDDKARQTPTA